MFKRYLIILVKEIPKKLVGPYLGIGKNLRKYWNAYGGIAAVICSPFFHFSILFTVLGKAQWINSSWWDLPLGIIPGTIGFTIGGYAILLAFGNEKFLEKIAGNNDDSEHSPYIIMSASLVHSVILQALALITAIMCKSIPCLSLKNYSNILWLDNCSNVSWYVAYGYSFLGFLIFMYAMMSIVAVALNIFRFSTWFDIAQTIEIETPQLDMAENIDEPVIKMTNEEI